MHRVSDKAGLPSQTREARDLTVGCNASSRYLRYHFAYAEMQAVGFQVGFIELNAARHAMRASGRRRDRESPGPV